MNYYILLQAISADGYINANCVPVGVTSAFFILLWQMLREIKAEMKFFRDKLAKHDIEINELFNTKKDHETGHNKHSDKGNWRV